MDPRPSLNVQRNLTYVRVPSNIDYDSYFTHQAIRAGVIRNDLRRSGYMRDGVEIREIVQRELEKEKIRDEIIAMEFAHKRALEAEIRREILIERGFAMQRPERYIPPTTPSMTHFGGRMRPWSLGHAESAAYNKSLPFHHSHVEATNLAFLRHQETVVVPEVQHLPETNLPFQRHQEAAGPEVQHPPKATTSHEVNLIPKPSAGKLLVLPKPINSGTMRKAEEAGLGGEPRKDPGKKKKGKKSEAKDWICKLCQVSATSEQGLYDHLKGKKHLAKASKMRGGRGKSFKGKGKNEKQKDKIESPSMVSKLQPRC